MNKRNDLKYSSNIYYILINDSSILVFSLFIIFQTAIQIRQFHVKFLYTFIQSK
jgi:hypothetical protein